MEISSVIERARTVSSVRGDDAADVDDLKAALRASSELQSWLASSKASLTRRLSDRVSFPEKTAAECTRGSTRDSIKDRERSDTLGAAPGFADALDDGKVTAGHVDALTNTAKGLDNDEQRAELFDRAAGLVGVASNSSVDDFRRRLGMESKNIRRNDGVDRLERQRCDTRLSTWIDGEGMWRLDGRFDPITGAQLAARLDAATQALFAEQTPSTCPSDPIAKQRHLQALALARLITGPGGVGVRPGRPEYIVVVDSSQSDGNGGPDVDWGIPVEVPHRVLADMMGEGTVHTVVVRNGVVVHAPGRLDLGRSTRLASPAQRRALRALYGGCAIPGCAVRYDRCKLHHVLWWRHGGRTDLDNLLPLCAHHHSKVHDAGWDVTLGPDRQLTIRFPDGTVHNTGPPTRTAA